MTDDDRRALQVLDTRLKILLPAEYQQTYESLEPVPMRSAGLKFGPDGLVAWNEMWATFCDLAMAGGPPHKGMLLEPATPAEIAARPDQHDRVVDEICRGIDLVSELQVRASPVPGWVRLICLSEAMAGWLLRAIVMENVSARGDGLALDLPAAPGFRLEKEIKNVITAVAKTTHYWTGHLPRDQKQAIADLFDEMHRESPLIQPGAGGGGEEAPIGTSLANRVVAATGLRPSTVRYDGWIGVQCASVKTAIWMMRAVITRNLLARREGTVLFVPVNASTDPDGTIVAGAVIDVHRLAVGRGFA